MKSTPQLVVDVAGRSDRGLVRVNNEDRIASVRIGRERRQAEGRLHAGEDVVLAVVADGVGGGPAGEVTSEAVVRGIPPRVTPRVDAAELARAMGDVHRERFAAVCHAPDADRSGSTATVLAVRGGAAFVAHVGDSRAYRLRGGVMQCLTRDQTIAEALVDEGRIADASLAQASDRKHLYQAIGVQEEIDVELRELRVRSGDVFILCTDGLHDLVRDDEIAAAAAAASASAVVATLVGLALARGGRDNVSVVVLVVQQVVGPEHPESAAEPVTQVRVLATLPPSPPPAAPLRRRLALVPLAIALLIGLVLWWSLGGGSPPIGIRGYVNGQVVFQPAVALMLERPIGSWALECNGAAVRTGNGFDLGAVPLAIGDNTIRVAVDGGRGVIALTLRRERPVALQSPLADAVIQAGSVTVRGTVEDPNLREVRVCGRTVPLVRGEHDGATFEVHIPLTARSTSIEIEANGDVLLRSVTYASGLRVMRPAATAPRWGGLVDVEGTVEDRTLTVVRVQEREVPVRDGRFSASAVQPDPQGHCRVVAGLDVLVIDAGVPVQCWEREIGWAGLADLSAIVDWVARCFEVGKGGVLRTEVVRCARAVTVRVWGVDPAAGELLQQQVGCPAARVVRWFCKDERQPVLGGDDMVGARWWPLVPVEETAIGPRCRSIRDALELVGAGGSVGTESTIRDPGSVLGEPSGTRRFGRLLELELSDPTPERLARAKDDYLGHDEELNAPFETEWILFSGRMLAAQGTARELAQERWLMTQPLLELAKGMGCAWSLVVVDDPRLPAQWIRWRCGWGSRDAVPPSLAPGLGALPWQVFGTAPSPDAVLVQVLGDRGAVERALPEILEALQAAGTVSNLDGEIVGAEVRLDLRRCQANGVDPQGLQFLLNDLEGAQVLEPGPYDAVPFLLKVMPGQLAGLRVPAARSEAVVLADVADIVPRRVAARYVDNQPAALVAVQVHEHNAAASCHAEVERIVRALHLRDVSLSVRP